jgi:aspartate racemase
VSDLSKRIDQLSPEKKALFELRMRQEGLSHAAVDVIARVPESSSYPLSFAQQRLWFLDQMEPGCAFYNEPLLAIRISGSLNRKAIAQTINEIVRRHESLRTTFTNVDGSPVQVIACPTPVPIGFIDLRLLPAAARETELRRLAQEEASRPFDLARGPLLRVNLLQLDDEDHAVFLEMHHIITDGWSNRLLLREIMLLYRAMCRGEPSPLLDLPIRYVDFAVWQSKRLRGEVLDNLVAYWKQQLSGELPVMELPADYPRPDIQRYIGRLETYVLDNELSQRIRQLCKSQDCTLFMTLFAALITLLYRYTGQEDIVVGTPIANRNRVETERVVGFFVNTLVLRVDVSGNPRFTELMSRIKKVAVGAYVHEDLPFEKLVELLQPERDLSRQALFQILFVLHNYPEASRDVLGLDRDLTLTRIEVDGGESKVDWALSVTELGDKGIKAQINYSTDLFKASTIRRMLRQYENLLRHVTANPETRLSAVRIFSDSDPDEGPQAAGASDNRNAILARLKNTRRKPVLVAPGNDAERREDKHAVS